MDQVRVRTYTGPVNADPAGSHSDATRSYIHAPVPELLQDRGSCLEAAAIITIFVVFYEFVLMVVGGTLTTFLLDLEYFDN